MKKLLLVLIASTLAFGSDVIVRDTLRRRAHMWLHHIGPRRTTPNATTIPARGMWIPIRAKREPGCL